MIDREPRTEVSHASLHAPEVQSASSTPPAPGAMLLSVSTIRPQDGTAWNMSLQEAASERGGKRRRNPIRLWAPPLGHPGLALISSPSPVGT